MRDAPSDSEFGSEPTSRLARQLVEAGGGGVRAVLLYGSQLLRTRPDRHSAYDFVVIVDEYRAFYASLRAAGELPRPAWLMTTMARFMPPNVIAFAPDWSGEIAKCLISSGEHFERALGPEPPDHFVLARMIQRVAIVWAASPEDETWARRELAEARRRVPIWMSPYLVGSFDAEELGRRMLEVCYEGELRPEAKDRADTIFAAQAEHFRSTFPAVLEAGAGSGFLVREVEARGPDASVRHELPRYELARPVTRPERRRWRWHFARSKARATARWLKHMITFANWLPYIVRKVERHTGRTIRLTPLERKLPIFFLWPRAIRVLLSRPQGDCDPSQAGPKAPGPTDSGSRREVES